MIDREKVLATTEDDVRNAIKLADLLVPLHKDDDTLHVALYHILLLERKVMKLIDELNKEVNR